MKVSSFLKIGLLLLFPMALIGSPVITYEVSQTHFGTVDLTNGAIFKINDIRNINEWNCGDQIELSYTDDAFLHPIIIKEGVPVVEHLFIITNTTQEKSVLGYLSTIPQSDLLTVVSINLLDGLITLSDSSMWSIYPIDQRFIGLWSPGDIILVGHNKGIDHQLFDGFIFNVTNHHVAHALLRVI